jgi:2-polyprenyl-3-methyl-5-hydroxy-6-metoxy-1,4-benzoquinol methylase
LSGTISYYDRNAEKFFSATVEIDLSGLYAPFLAHIPPGARILDAGCGSGRDSRYFLQHGYTVEAFDASSEMCCLASSHIGQTVLQKTFEQVDYDSEFDGVWACASLLHVPRDHIDAVLQRFTWALKPGGVMFMSFKLRDGEWEQDGRFFNGYNETSFRELIKEHPSFLLCSIWITDDVRPDRKREKWLNALIRRIGN